MSALPLPGTAARFKAPAWLTTSWRPALKLGLLAVGGLLAAAVVALALALTVVPLTGAYATYVVLSDSMEPAIAAGSVVIVAHTDPATLKIGDIISYTSSVAPYPTITHRVTAINHDADGRLSFKTKGDANVVEDPWDLHYANRAGVVRAWVPLAGYAVVAVTTALGRSLLGVLLAALVGLLWFTAVWVRPRVAAQVERVVSLRNAALNAGNLPPISPVRVAILGWLAYALLIRGGRLLR